jgi:hypothetical protein
MNMKSFIETCAIASMMVLMSTMTFYGALGVEPVAPKTHMEAQR